MVHDSCGRKRPERDKDTKRSITIAIGISTTAGRTPARRRRARAQPVRVKLCSIPGYSVRARRRPPGLLNASSLRLLDSRSRFSSATTAACHQRSTHRARGGTHTHEACHTSRHLARFSECCPLIIKISTQAAPSGGAHAPSLSSSWNTRQTASRDGEGGGSVRCNATDTRALTALPAETVYHSHHLAEMHAHLTKNHRLRAHQTPPVAHTRQKPSLPRVPRR